jgi:hypothetical protein
VKQVLVRPPAGFVVLLAAVVLGLSNAACPGTLPETTGTAGTTGNCTPTGPAPCDAFTTIFAGQRCSAAGCHGAGQPQGIDLQSPGVSARLLDKTSTSATCGTVATPYLLPNSNPAAGLFVEKLHPNPSCGLIMPFAGFGGELTADELACIMDWSTAVTSRCWTQ